jgi:hypothetical protein
MIRDNQKTRWRRPPRFSSLQACAVTCLVWSIEAGVPVSKAFAQQAPKSGSGLTFVQISDSHSGSIRAI